ncbi:MAG TPA: FlgD immunoglobulin-like domain containing protein, partial [Candidatus Acidoferrum sp.]|nr:FlgD immunoglobulin-like domain containing protein [Candidatus Acidoferrum sp.]
VIVPKVSACFETQIDTIQYPLRVTFENCTPQSIEQSFIWDFGDSTGTSQEISPVHWYDKSGCYPVTLIAATLCRADTLHKTVCVGDAFHIHPTDQWIDVYCGAPTLDSVPLAHGTVIEAFSPRGVLCGLGIVRQDGSFGFMPIYRDDIYTPEDEGAHPGDTIAFKINGTTAFVEPPVIWTALGARVPACQFVTRANRVVHLVQGWNLISWNVAYSDSLPSAIAGIKNCVDAVLGFEHGGLTYDPQLEEFSTLTHVDYLHGYWLHLTCDADLQIAGMPINRSEAIPVYQDWNLVSYWPDTVYSVSQGFESIISGLMAAFTWENGLQLWLPNQIGFNTLVDLHPGLGYWIKLSDDGTLIYPGFGGTRVSSGRFATRTGDGGVMPSRTWMSVYGSHITVDGAELASGTTIELTTANGVKCGSAQYGNGLLKFTPVYGFDDGADATRRYPKEKEPVQIAINGKRVYPDLVWSANGARVRLSAVTSDPGNQPGGLPDHYVLNQNYPNPFNPGTQISFALPVAGKVTLEIFNVTGQHIRTLVDGAMTAGTHVVPWDGTDATGTPVAGGVYLYRLTSGSFVEARKMILLK